MQTKFTIVRIAGALAASIALTPAAHAAAPADHHAYEAAGLSALKLDAGKKWATDAPLRQGMAAIRDAIAADRETIHAGRMSTARYDALAKKIDAEVADIVQNCKLAPAADAQLHMILAEMTHGLDAVKGKDKKVTRRAGVEKIAASLDAYSKYFDHPSWRALN